MKRNLLIVILLIILCGGRSYSQSPQMVTTLSNSYGGSLKEEFFGGSFCSDGGYFLTGLTNSVDGDILMAIPLDTSNIFVVKTDSNGVKQWTGTYGGSEYDKARYGMEDLNNDFLVVGTTHSSDGYITFTHGHTELFILKLNQSGDLIWMKQYGGTGWESGRYIMQLSDGNYLITGYSTSSNGDLTAPTHGGHDGWLLKTDTSGTVIWSHTYGGTGDDRIRYVQEAPDGSLYFAGSSTSNDYDLSGNKGGTDYWAGKTDANGNLIWSKLLGGSGEDWSYNIVPSGNDNYLLTGYSTSDDGDLSGNFGDTDGWIVMIDTSGNIIAQNHFGGSGGDRLYKTLTTASGGFISAGYAQSTDFDLAGANSGISKTYWLAYMDSALNLTWSRCTGGSAADLGKELIYNPATGSSVIIGDSNSSNGDVLNNHGNFDFWMVRLDLFTDTFEIPDSEDLNAYYDNNSGTFTVNSRTDNYFDIRITNIAGQLIYSIPKTFMHKGRNTFKLRNFDPANGIYTITIAGKSSNYNKKFVISGK